GDRVPRRRRGKMGAAGGRSAPTAATPRASRLSCTVRPPRTGAAAGAVLGAGAPRPMIRTPDSRHCSQALGWASMDSKTELEKELSDIRREVIESRNLVIKTDNLVKGLHAELKGFGKRQDDVQKHLWVSSGVSYFLFTVLIAAASLAVLFSRSGAARR